MLSSVFYQVTRSCWLERIVVYAIHWNLSNPPHFFCLEPSYIKFSIKLSQNVASVLFVLLIGIQRVCVAQLRHNAVYLLEREDHLL